MITVNGKKLNIFPLKLGQRQECSFSLLLFNIVLEVEVRDWEGINKAVFFPRWHDLLARKSEIINKNTPATTKQLQLVAGNKLIYKSHSLSYVQAMSTGIWNSKLITIYICIPPKWDTYVYISQNMFKICMRNTIIFHARYQRRTRCSDSPCSWIGRLIQMKNFSAKVNVKRMRTQATNWEKIFAKDRYDKALLFKIYKELFKLLKQ